MTDATTISAGGAGQADRDWWRGCTIYQIYPRSFQDSTGDGMGDLKGVTARLGHVASLGVDAIWLSPFFRSPMADMGYDVSDYCAVDPIFGTIEDFDALVAEAHRLGLKLVIDQVLSHTSDQHPWFMESRSSRENPKADWYVWADSRPDGTAPNNWLSVFGGPAWEWDSTRRQYYLHNFLTAQPDLNFHNEEVQEALLSSVRFWLERGVDGFRLDTVNFYFHDEKLRDNPPVDHGSTADMPGVNPYGFQDHQFDKTRPENIGFLKRLRSLLDEYDARMTVGELEDGPRSLTTVAAYTSGNDKLNMCYTFDMLRADFSAAHVRHSVEAFESKVRDGWICWAFSNHDVPRHVTRWARPGQPPDALARFSILLLATMRGSICIYQGEELGLEEAELDFADLRDPYGIRFWPGFKGRDGCRTPMVWDDSRNAGFSTGRPWLPVPAEQRARAVATLDRDPGSILSFYRRVLSFRKAHRALQTGSLRFLEAHSDILAFVREDDGERLLCVFNFAAAPADWIVPGGIGDLEPIEPELTTGRLKGRDVLLGPLGVFLARLG